MIFLRECRLCGSELVEGEDKFCLHCLSKLPRWLLSNDDLRAHRLPRTAPIAGVWPWLAYSNSDPFCSLIREGKFNDRPDLIEDLSERYADRLEAEGHLAGIEAVIPVPMHWWKRFKRGYNQAEIIAETIADCAGIPMVKAIKAVKPHAVQSRKTGDERAANVRGIFALRRKDISGKHVAIVDDILTTGSTLSEAINTLLKGNPASVTVLTLAATT